MDSIKIKETKRYYHNDRLEVQNIHFQNKHSYSQSLLLN